MLVAGSRVVLAPGLQLVLAFLLIRSHDRLADVLIGLHVAAARPARGKVGIANAVVDRFLGEGAGHARAAAAGGGYRLRSDTVLDPGHHLLEHGFLVRLRARAAAAMRHAGHAEVAPPGLQHREVRRALAEVRSGAGVVLEPVLGGDELVRRALPHEDLLAGVAHAVEAHIHRVDDVAGGIRPQLGLASVVRECQRAPVEAGVRMVPLQLAGGRLRWSRAIQRAHLCTALEAGEDLQPEAVARAVPNQVDRFRLLRRQAIRRRRSGRAADVGLGAEGAAARVAKDAVDHAVLCVARGDRRGRGLFLLWGSDRPAGELSHGDRAPDLRQAEAPVVDRRSAYQPAVKLFRVALREREALAAAGGAAVPIVAGGREPVIDRRDRLRPLHLRAQAVDDEVVQPPDVEARRRGLQREKAIAANVAGVGRGTHIAGAGGRGNASDGAGAAAAAEVARSPVPGAFHAARTAVAAVARQAHADRYALVFAFVVAEGRPAARRIDEVDLAARVGAGRYEGRGKVKYIGASCQPESRVVPQLETARNRGHGAAPGEQRENKKAQDRSHCSPLSFGFVFSAFAGRRDVDRLRVGAHVLGVLGQHPAFAHQLHQAAVDREGWMLPEYAED